MSEQESRKLREEFLAGMDITFQKLVEEKKKNNSELAFAEKKGDIVKVKATDIVK